MNKTHKKNCVTLLFGAWLCCICLYVYLLFEASVFCLIDWIMLLLSEE